MNPKKETNPEIKFSGELYLVERTIWEHGSGMCSGNKILCSDLETAILVCEGLKKMYPQHLNINPDDKDGIDRKVSISIHPARRRDAESFVKEKDW